MNESRIAELLEPFLAAIPTPCRHSEERSDQEPARLSPAQLHSISTYIDILVRWNARINLTAIRNPEQIITRHFGESLFAARHLFPIDPDVRSTQRAGGTAALQGRVNSVEMTGASAPAPANDPRPTANDRPTIADLGSGAGFPGLPIKLWAPHISLTLIESNHKKAAFLKEVARALTLTDVNIQNARAETLAENTLGENIKNRYDVVTLRAVERFETILPTAAALVKPTGRLALLIGSAQEPQARAALPSWHWLAPITIPQSRSRVLLIAKIA